MACEQPRQRSRRGCVTAPPPPPPRVRAHLDATNMRAGLQVCPKSAAARALHESQRDARRPKARASGSPDPRSRSGGAHDELDDGDRAPPLPRQTDDAEQPKARRPRPASRSSSEKAVLLLELLLAPLGQHPELRDVHPVEQGLELGLRQVTGWSAGVRTRESECVYGQMRGRMARTATDRDGRVTGFRRAATRARRVFCDGGRFSATSSQQQSGRCRS